MLFRSGVPGIYRSLLWLRWKVKGFITVFQFLCDLGDNDVGFSYKPPSAPLRRELGNTTSNVTTGIASGSITTGADEGSGGSVSYKVVSEVYVKSLGKKALTPTTPTKPRDAPVAVYWMENYSAPQHRGKLAPE